MCLLHVSLTDILESELGAALSCLACCELVMQQVLGDPTILHPEEVSFPTKASLS